MTLYIEKEETKYDQSPPMVSLSSFVGNLINSKIKPTSDLTHNPDLDHLYEESLKILIAEARLLKSLPELDAENELPTHLQVWKDELYEKVPIQELNECFELAKQINAKSSYPITASDISRIWLHLQQERMVVEEQKRREAASRSIGLSHDPLAERITLQQYQQEINAGRDQAKLDLPCKWCNNSGFVQSMLQIGNLEYKHLHTVKYLDENGEPASDDHGRVLSRPIVCDHITPHDIQPKVFKDLVEFEYWLRSGISYERYVKTRASV